MAFEKMISASRDDVPLVLYYALKQQEGKDAISGWEQMLQGLVDAGLHVTATWPTHTEQRGGLRTFKRNALASSIVIAARKRLDDAKVATRREFRDALSKELPERLRELQQALIAPVDLAQASIGPGMAVFTRYARVVEADGASMSVGTAMSIIRQSLSEVLREKEDAYDKYTAWAVSWFELNGTEPGAYGDAEVLSKAMNVSISAMHDEGFVKAGGNKVALVPRDELPDAWDPTTDARLTVWEITQHLIRALLVSEESAADIARKLGSDYGDRARDLAYRLFSICEEKDWAKEAGSYNALVVAWPEIARLAAEVPSDVQESLLGE
jgi:putative DNA methylase